MFLLGRGLFALVALALWVYCIFDVIRTEDARVQNLPKTLWLMIVIFVPTIGSLAWLLLGRPSAAGFDLGRRKTSHPTRPGKPSTGLPQPPPPDPAEHQARREEAIRRYMAEREESRKREEEIRRLEEEIRRKDQPPGGS